MIGEGEMFLKTKDNRYINIFNINQIILDKNNKLFVSLNNKFVELEITEEELDKINNNFFETLSLVSDSWTWNGIKVNIK